MREFLEDKLEFFVTICAGIVLVVVTFFGERIELSEIAVRFIVVLSVSFLCGLVLKYYLKKLIPAPLPDIEEDSGEDDEGEGEDEVEGEGEGENEDDYELYDSDDMNLSDADDYDTNVDNLDEYGDGTETR